MKWNEMEWMEWSSDFQIDVYINGSFKNWKGNKYKDTDVVVGFVFVLFCFVFFFLSLKGMESRPRKLAHVMSAFF